MPGVAARRTSRSGCPSKSPPASASTSVQVVLTARRLACAAMVVEAWLARAAAHAPASARRWRRPRAACTYAELHARARGAAGRAGRARRRARASASRSRCRPASTSPSRCTPACCSAPSPCRSTCACAERERERDRRRAPGARGRRAAGRRAPRGAGRRGPERRGHDLDATAVVIHTSGTSAAPQAGRADLRQPAVERARLGRRARASTRASAGCARCRSSHVGGLSILVRSAIYATTAVRARALRDRARRCTRCASERDHARRASSRRRSRGCSTRASSDRRRCAARSPAAARCPPALVAARARRRRAR